MLINIVLFFDCEGDYVLFRWESERKKLRTRRILRAMVRILFTWVFTRCFFDWEKWKIANA